MGMSERRWILPEERKRKQPEKTNGPETIPYREGVSGHNGYVLAEVREENKPDAPAKKFWINRAVLHGPLQNEDINGLLPMVRWTWRHLPKMATWCRTFEDWELGFIRVSDPAQEVVAWIRIIYGALTYMHENPEANHSVVFASMLSIVNGAADHVQPASLRKRLEELSASVPEYFFDTDSFSEDGELKTGDEYLR
jgi:hypothetical protein